MFIPSEIRDQIPGSRFQASGSRLQTSDSMLQFGNLIPDT
jgi:hypothetical protein